MNVALQPSPCCAGAKVEAVPASDAARVKDMRTNLPILFQQVVFINISHRIFSMYQNQAVNIGSQAQKIRRVNVGSVQFETALHQRIVDGHDFQHP